MRFKSIFFQLRIILVLLAFVGCTIGGLTKTERLLINSGESNDIMTLFVVDNPTDSVFLRQSARGLKPRHFSNENIIKLKSRMLATVNDPDNAGVGIAAPQLGISIRMIYVQRLDKEGAPFEVYFNPSIEKMGDSIKIGREGCLSVPGYWGMVKRPQCITLRYLDALGNEKSEEICGFTAVIFQHELDHLNGVLYYDYVQGEGTLEQKLQIDDI